MASKRGKDVGGDLIDQVTQGIARAKQQEREAAQSASETLAEQKNAVGEQGHQQSSRAPAPTAARPEASASGRVSFDAGSPQKEIGAIDRPVAGESEQPFVVSAGNPKAPPVRGAEVDGEVSLTRAGEDASRTEAPGADAPGTESGEHSARFWTADGTYCYQTGERKYELQPVGSAASSSRMRIRLTYQGKLQFDALDLVSSRARRNFAHDIQRIWSIPSAAIEADLGQIICRIEREREGHQRAAASPAVHTSAADLSEAERRAGMELLCSVDIVEHITCDIERLGYVGEANASLLVYLAATSRKLSSPLSVIIVSESASGKSYLVETVRKMLPAAEVVAVTSLSDQALNYLDDLRHKFLILGEAVHSEAVEHQIREMLSAHELRRLVTVKDAASGRMVSRMVSKEVVVASVMSGTSYRLNPENASRCFVIGTDESEEQTRRIHAAQRSKHTLAGIKRSREEVPTILARHRSAQVLLEPVAVVNPFAEQLDFPAHRMRLRRDHQRFLDLIASIAFLRQYQKERKRSGELEYLEADLTDYRIAYEVMTAGVLEQTLRDLPKAATRLLAAIERYVRAEAERQRIEPALVSFTQRMIREATNASHSWVQKNLKVLVEYEYVDIAHGGTSRKRGFYRLVASSGVRGQRTTSLPSPEALARWLG